MTKKKPTGRAAVSEFFKFSVPTLVERINRKLLYGGIGVAIVGLFFATGGAGKDAIGLSPLMPLLGLGVAAYQALNGAKDWMVQRKHNKVLGEFARLAGEVRKMQSAEAKKAVLRIFERAGVDRSELVVFDEKYQLSAEASVFSEESADDALGDLSNKSLRLVSRGKGSNEHHRAVRWTDRKVTEQFFNPVRIVSLAFTQSQIVICDIQLDSVDGDLEEHIRKINVNQIVSIGFSSKRTRVPLTEEQALSIASDLDFTEEEIKDVERGFKTESEDTWVLEETLSELGITQTDTTAVSIPMGIERIFGKHLAALDQDSALTPDEGQIDRIVNELNRLVDGRRTSAPS